MLSMPQWHFSLFACLLQDSLHWIITPERPCRRIHCLYRSCPGAQGVSYGCSDGICTGLCKCKRWQSNFMLPKCSSFQDIHSFIFLVTFQEGSFFLFPNSQVSCHYLFWPNMSGWTPLERAYFLCFGTKGSFPLKRIGQALKGLRESQFPCLPANPSQACCFFHWYCSGSLSSVVT